MASRRYTGQLVTSETTTDASQDVNENSRQQNNSLLCSSATRNARDLISWEYDGELRDKSYGDGSPNEICVFKLDQEKIDELANDYHSAETCVSPSGGGGGTIQNKRYKETVKSDGSSSRNEDEFRCKSSRERKTRRGMPDGVIIIPGDAVRGASRSGITIGVISVRDLIPETRKRPRSSTWRRSSKMEGGTSKTIDSPILTVFYADNSGKMKGPGRSVGRECGSYRMATGCTGYDPTGSMRDVSHPDANATIGVPNRLENRLSERQELCTEDNLHPFCMADKILDSGTCRHHDDAPMDVNHAQHRTWDEERAYLDARNHIANFRCSVFNDEHQECRVCNRENYNAAGFDFDRETRADWTTKCVHPEEARARGCRCSCEFTRKYRSDVNTQHCYWPMPAKPSENFASSGKRPREEEIEQFGSNTPEFVTEANECCPEIECGDRKCANCDEGGSSVSAIQECTALRAGVFIEPSKRDAGFRGSSIVDAARFDITPRARKREWTTERRSEDEWPNKSDSQKVADTRDARARRGCTGRCHDGHVVAMPLPSGRSPGKTGGSVPREVDSKWKYGSIETGAQQLDYKWKRRVATVDANARADFTGKRDSRSQMRNDSTNVNCKCGETRDYSLWGHLRTDKIWSRIHDACKNTIKLAATSVGRAMKSVSRSEQRNLVEVTDAARVEDSSLCTDRICEETCRKNLMPAKAEEISKVHEERTIEDVEKYRGDMDVPVQKNSMAITSSCHDVRVHMCQNAEEAKNGKSCVFYSEDKKDRYRDITQFLPRNQTYSQDEDVHPQSPLSGSFTCLKDSVYLRLRNRGGSDNNRNLAKNDGKERESVQRRNNINEATSLSYRPDSIPRECACYPRTQESRIRYAEHRNPSRRTDVRYESSVITHCRAIQTDESDVSRSNPHRVLGSTGVSLPEGNRRTGVQATSGTTRGSPEKGEEYGNAERVPSAANSETESNLISRSAEIADATVSSTEADTAAHSSRNEPNEPIPSTSKWQTPFVVTSSESRENRPASGWPSCTTAMRFWRKRPAAGDKVITSAFKRKRSIGRKRLSGMNAGRNSGMKITQIEQSTVQTAREGNKARRRTYVNVRAQTSDAIVTRILSEFLVSGEKRRRIMMTITLDTESDRDSSDGKEVTLKEAGTQTLSNDVASVGTGAFGYPFGAFGYPTIPTATASRTVQCFVCDKQDCYEIKHSDDSISFEEALIAEYPETSEFDDRFAERRADLEAPP